MKEPCMYDILELSETSLKKVLPKASSRTLVRLLTAYPRTVGRTFMTVLHTCVSPSTLEFLREELIRGQQPTFVQIREAETEIIQILRDEHLLPRIAA
jgi:hypothetical protein